jgi:hypothetical protein
VTETLEEINSTLTQRLLCEDFVPGVVVTVVEEPSTVPAMQIIVHVRCRPEVSHFGRRAAC